jgi:hypothetical protein
MDLRGLCIANPEGLQTLLHRHGGTDWYIELKECVHGTSLGILRWVSEVRKCKEDNP